MFCNLLTCSHNLVPKISGVREKERPWERGRCSHTCLLGVTDAASSQFTVVWAVYLFVFLSGQARHRRHHWSSSTSTKQRESTVQKSPGQKGWLVCLSTCVVFFLVVIVVVCLFVCLFPSFAMNMWYTSRDLNGTYLWIISLLIGN